MVFYIYIYIICVFSIYNELHSLYLKYIYVVMVLLLSFKATIVKKCQPLFNFDLPMIRYNSIEENSIIYISNTQYIYNIYNNKICST